MLPSCPTWFHAVQQQLLSHISQCTRRRKQGKCLSLRNKKSVLSIHSSKVKSESVAGGWAIIGTPSLARVIMSASKNCVPFSMHLQEKNQQKEKRRWNKFNSQDLASSAFELTACPQEIWVTRGTWKNSHKCSKCASGSSLQKIVSLEALEKLTTHIASVDPTLRARCRAFRGMIAVWPAASRTSGLPVMEEIRVITRIKTKGAIIQE